MNTLAILVAAGRGDRLQKGLPKAFVRLGGETLLLRSARALAAARSVDAIVAVVPESEIDSARAILAPVAKVNGVVGGGARRQDSVLEGMRQAPPRFAGVVLVHDAARPLVETTLVDAVVEAALRHGAALPVAPVADTLKRLHGDSVAETVDRSELGAAQTPQGFHFQLLVRAYEAAFRDDVTLTDEAMAVERIGERVVIVPGSPVNRKITTPEDLEWAEVVLRRRREP